MAVELEKKSKKGCMIFSPVGPFLLASSVESYWALASFGNCRTCSFLKGKETALFIEEDG
jgi:hypothetical protein